MWGAAICSHERRYSPRPEESKQGFPYSWHSRRLWTSCCGRKQNSRTLEKQPSLKCWAISLALKRFDFEKRNPQAFMGLTETVTHLDSGLVNSSLAERAPPTSQGVHSGAPIRAASCTGVLGVLAIQALRSRWQWRLCWGTFQALRTLAMQPFQPAAYNRRLSLAWKELCSLFKPCHCHGECHSTFRWQEFSSWLQLTS